MIKMQVIGNLGKDCVVNTVNGKNVINFSVAHTERFKDSQGNQKERTTWVECAYWTDRTAVAQYLVKGKTIYAEGYPEADAYLNKENQAAATLRMRVQTVQLLGGGNSGDNAGQNANHSGQYTGAASGGNYGGQPANYQPQVAAQVADDLPF